MIMLTPPPVNDAININILPPTFEYKFVQKFPRVNYKGH